VNATMLKPALDSTIGMAVMYTPLPNDPDDC
jgi:hypothetical protein